MIRFLMCLSLALPLAAWGQLQKIHPCTLVETEWAEQLKDLELTAARAGLGAWRHTDWAKLPQDRKEARDEVAEIETAKGKRAITEDQPVEINTSARDELMGLPGIGEKTANRIIEARPFSSIEDLSRVQGISSAGLDKLRPFLTLGKP